MGYPAPHSDSPSGVRAEFGYTYVGGSHLGLGSTGQVRGKLGRTVRGVNHA